MARRPHRTTRPLALAAALAAGMLAVACDAPEADLPADDDFLAGGKADGAFGVEEGSAEAKAVLKLANEAALVVLDDDVGLDRRAAENIVATRDAAPITTLAELDAIKFVGKSAFGKLVDYVRDEGLVDDPTTLRISTFNIRWFGLNGDLTGSLGTESRVDTVRAFIEEHLADRDVLVFEEIVDTKLFFEEVVPDYECVSYEHGNDGKHQHVVVCHTDQFVFEPTDGDDDFLLEDVDLNGFLRPAVYGTLHTVDGEPVAQLMAVHLKANEQSTAKRMEQAEIIEARISELRDASDLPVIVTGDFNSHFAIHTGRTDDDEVIIEDILAPLERVHLPVTFTYQEPSVKQRRLDQAYISPGVRVDHVASPGPCDLDPVADLAEIQTHYDTISDHCPVIVDLTLP